MPDYRTCGRCHGTGRILIRRICKLTLELLRLYPDGITGAELSKVDGCKATAMNNRLAMLEKHGLAKSKVDGRKRIYRSVKNGKRHGRTRRRSRVST